MTIAPTRPRIATAVFTVLLLTMAGCSKASKDDAGGGDSSKAPKIANTHAKAGDGEYKTTKAITIKLADGSSTVKGAGATVKGDVVTITQAGTYVLSGALTNGQVNVNSAG